MLVIPLLPIGQFIRQSASLRSLYHWSHFYNLHALSTRQIVFFIICRIRLIGNFEQCYVAMETTKCTIMYGTNAKCRFSYQSMEEWVYSTVCYRRYEKAYVRPTPVALLLARHYLFQFHPRNNQNQRFGVHNTSLTPPFVIEVPVTSL